MKIGAKSDLPQEVQEMRSKRLLLLRRVKESVRAASFAVERRVKNEMPVDTGRARASWGHWSPGDLTPRAKGASAHDAVWEDNQDGLSISQGSNVDYIDRLNEGHSAQAAKGFLDRAEEKGQEELDKLIDDIMRTW